MSAENAKYKIIVFYRKALPNDSIKGISYHKTQKTFKTTLPNTKSMNNVELFRFYEKIVKQYKNNDPDVEEVKIYKVREVVEEILPQPLLPNLVTEKPSNIAPTEVIQEFLL